MGADPNSQTLELASPPVPIFADMRGTCNLTGHFHCSLMFIVHCSAVDHLDARRLLDFGRFLFMLIYFLNGLVGAFAETGTTIMLTQKFEDKLGAVTASIGTVCGLGCLAGPTIGGILYVATCCVDVLHGVQGVQGVQGVHGVHGVHDAGALSVEQPLPIKSPFFNARTDTRTHHAPCHHQALHGKLTKRMPSRTTLTLSALHALVCR